MIRNRTVVAFAFCTSAALALPAAAQPCDPSKPRNVRASDGIPCAHVFVEWAAPSQGNAINYQIFRGPSPSQATTLIGTSVDRQFSDLTAGFATHFYRVKAVGACGTSGFSDADSGRAAGAPNPPTGVSATRGTRCGDVRITWDDRNDATSWTVYLEAPPLWIRLGPTNTPSYVHENPLPATTHRYRVEAENSCGISDPSDTVAGHAGRDPQSPDVTASTDECDGITLRWGEDPWAGRPLTYTIWRNDQNVFLTANKMDELQGYHERYTDSSVAPGSRYFYWVEVKNDCVLLPQRNVIGAEGERLPWPHSITQHPANVSAPEGSRAEFSVEVTGQTPREYAWYHDGVALQNGGNIRGASEAVLTIEPVRFGDAGMYEVRVYNSTCPSSYRTSNPATLEVTPVECYADCTGDTVLDIFDFLCFQNRFATNDPYACDCDTGSGPGVCDIFDFLCFQNAYDAGCP